MNTKSPRLTALSSDQKKALHGKLYKSLNRESLVKDVYRDTAQVAYGVVPSFFGGLTEPVEMGDTQPDNIGSLTLLAANDGDSRRLSEIARGAFASAGVTIEPSFVDLGTFSGRLLGGEGFDVALVWLEMNLAAVGPLPYGMFFDPTSPFTILGEPIDGLTSSLALARSILPAPERKAAYCRVLAEVSARQTAWVPIISRNATWLGSSRVGDIGLDVNGKLHLALVRSSGA